MDNIEKLEIDLTYLQNNFEELSTIVLEQSNTINKLQKHVKLLNEKILALEGEAESRKPPHY